MLILLSGVPTTGTSAVAGGLSRVLPAPVFSVYPTESANVSRVLRYLGRPERS